MKKRFLSILMAITMVCSFTACKDNGTSSDLSEPSDISSSTDNVSDTDNTSQDSSTVVSTNSGSGNSASGNKNPGDTNSGNTNSENNNSIDYESLKGSTVKVLMWRSLTEQEKKTIAAFEKQYSMKVTVEESSSSSYMTKIASLVSTKQSPDIAIIPGGKGAQGAFPLGVVTVFQPVSVTKQDFSDSFWNQEAMKAYSVKGKPYAMISSETNWYNNYAVLFYNADMFKADGIQTPYALWKANNWNWDTMKSTAQEIKKKGHDYGAVIDQELNFMYSTGTEFISYNGTKFTNSITDSRVIDAWTFEAQLIKDGLMPVYGTASGAFQSAKAGMFISNSWAMRKGEVLSTADFNIECVPFPSPKGQEIVVGANHNLWAVPKGANNPVGAGVFIKYFLDADNNGNFSDITLNTQFEEIFNYTNQASIKHCYQYSFGVVGYTQYKALSEMLTTLHKSSPEQIPTVLQKYKSVFENAVNTSNSKLGVS